MPARRGVDRLLVGVGPLVAAALLTVTVAVLRLQSCLAVGWSGQEPFYRQCYTDLANSVQVDGLGRGLAAYLAGELSLDQPPLTGLAMALLGGLTDSPTILTAQRAFIGVWAVVAVVLLVVMAWSVRRVGGDATQVVLSPVVVLTVLLAPDLIGVALATTGLVAWLRGRPRLAGILLGLGVLARTYPILIVLAIIAVALIASRGVGSRRTGELRAFGEGLGAAWAVVVMLVIPFSSGNFSLLVQPWISWWTAPTGLGSLWHLPALGGHPLPVWAGSVLAVLGWVLALALGALAIQAARVRRPGATVPVAALSLLVVAVVLVTGKSVPVQASLWLVPLVALAGLRWRDHLIWAAGEAIHFVAVWLYLGGLTEGSKGIPVQWYAVAVLVRVLAIGWLALRAWDRTSAGVVSKRRDCYQDPNPPALFSDAAFVSQR